MPIFPARALLQINFTDRVENQDVNGTMAQVIPMHLRAAGIAQNPVVFIDDGEALIIRLAHIRARWRPNEIRKCNPLKQREFFGSSFWIDVELARETIPVIDLLPKQLS